MTDSKAVQLDPNAHPGVMLALMLSPEQQALITANVPGRLAKEADHCTLISLASDASTMLDRKADLLIALAAFARSAQPISAAINGYAAFSGNDEEYPFVLLLDSPALPKLHHELCEVVERAGIAVEARHGFIPHITLAYLPADKPTPRLERQAIPLEFTSISLVWAGERIDLPLAGASDENDGGEVVYSALSTKSLPSTNPYRIRKYGVVWGGSDLVGDTFERDTDLGRSRSFVGMPAYYSHAMDTLKEQVGAVANVEEDDEGLIFEIELDKAKRYAETLRQLNDAGVLGASTGALGHLVQRQNGKLKRWIIGEISLTPQPAEPRTLQPVKSLYEEETPMGDNQPTQPTQSGADVAQLASTVQTLTATVQSVQNDLNDLKSMPAVKAAETLGGAIGGGLTARADDAPDTYHHFKALTTVSRRGAAVAATEYPEGVFGGYIKAIFNAHKSNPSVAGDAHKALRDVYGASTDHPAAKALGSSAGVDGAYNIPEQFIATLMQVARQKDVLYGRTMIIPSTGGEIVIPALDTSGAYVAGQSQMYGGVSISWGDDDADATTTQPKFQQVRLKTNAMKAFTRIKNQLMLKSAIEIDAVVSEILGAAIGRARDYAILRGTGSGQPLGVLNAPATVDVAGSAIDFATLAGMENYVIPERDENYIWVIHTKRRSGVYALQQTNNTLVTFLNNLRDKPKPILLGREVAWTDKVPYASGDVSNSVNLIDPSMIVVSEYQGIAISVSDQARFEQDETVIRAILSMDAQPWLKSKIEVASSEYLTGFVTI